MTVKDIKLSEISTEDLTQLENLIQKEKQNRKENRRKELCNKIIKDLEAFQKEFPYEVIAIMYPNCDEEEIEIYCEDIISQMKDNWRR
jgi:hypothetical protein